MTTPKEVSRWPEKGQFWIWKSPLALMRIDDIGNEGNDPGILSTYRWTPLGEEVVLFTPPLMPERAEFLWWEQMMTLPEHYEPPKPLMVGDVLIARTNFADGRVSDGRLLFIGPGTTDKANVHVLATWEVSDSDLWSPVYQYGPGHLAIAGKTSYDHVLEGAL